MNAKTKTFFYAIKAKYSNDFSGKEETCICPFCLTYHTKYTGKYDFISTEGKKTIRQAIILCLECNKSFIYEEVETFVFHGFRRLPKDLSRFMTTDEIISHIDNLLKES